MASTMLVSHVGCWRESSLFSNAVESKWLRSSTSSRLSLRRQPGQLVRVTASAEKSEPSFSAGRSHVLRPLLLAAVTSPFLSFLGPAKAEETALFTDSADKFTLVVPQGWESGEGKAGTRKVLAFYPINEGSDKQNTNVNVVITMLGADFTSLGSFGTAENFGETLVNGLDRSWKRPPGQAARLISAKENNGLYVIEYTLHRVGMPKQHFVSVVGLRFNGIYNRLFTVTGQYLDEEADLYRNAIEKTVKSFQFTS